MKANTRTTSKANKQFGSTEHAGSVPKATATLPSARKPGATGAASDGLAPLSSARGTSAANVVPGGLTPSTDPVYLEGRLVLSLSFKGETPDLAPIKDDEVVLENYRLWDELAESWYEEELAVLRFERADVVMRLEPTPTAIWTGELDTHARVVLVPDLDTAGFMTNQACDLCWKRV